MLAVQTGLLDPLPLAAVAAFRAGLPAALDRDAAEALHSLAADRRRWTPSARDGLMAALTRLAASLTPAETEPRPAERPGQTMTERLADISARIDGIRQLGAVVNAMKGIAAARANMARTQVEAVDSYAATIAAAMARVARPRLPATPTPVPNRTTARPACWCSAPNRALPAPSANACWTVSAPD